MINGDARSGCEGLLAYGPLSLAGSYVVELRSRVCMRRIIPTWIQLQYPHDHILLWDATDPVCTVANQRLPPTCASQVLRVVRRDLPLCLIRRRMNRRPWLCIHRSCPRVVQTAGLYEIRSSDAKFIYEPNFRILPVGQKQVERFVRLAKLAAVPGGRVPATRLASRMPASPICGGSRTNAICYGPFTKGAANQTEIE
jgi:hypothetical protein